VAEPIYAVTENFQDEIYQKLRKNLLLSSGRNCTPEAQQTTAGRLGDT